MELIVFKKELSLVAVLLLAALGSCAMDPRTKNAPANSKSVNSEQSSVEDLKLREAWEDKTKGLNKQSHDYPLEKLDALRSLLSQVPEQQVKNEFDRIAQSPVGYWELNEYEQTFVQASIMSQVEAQDRSALVALFSSKAPEFIGAEPIALYLSISSSIQDPLLVLFDSYDKTTNVETKKDLLSMLGHAFRSIREKSTADEEFVSQSKQWYLQNHTKLELNPYYHPDSLFPELRELFVQKPTNQKRPGVKSPANR